jgi:hypothetical protein
VCGSKASSDLLRSRSDFGRAGYAYEPRALRPLQRVAGRANHEQSAASLSEVLGIRGKPLLDLQRRNAPRESAENPLECGEYASRHRARDD